MLVSSPLLLLSITSIVIAALLEEVWTYQDSLRGETVSMLGGLWPGASLSYNRSSLQSQAGSEEGSHLAVDGDPTTCAVSSGESRWWQVQIQQSLVTSVGLVLPSNTLQHLSIFVIQMLEGNQARYKPCSALEGLTISQYVLFTCNKDQGLLGDFIYIRDERVGQEEFSLCEVEVFNEKEEDLECGTPDSPAGGSVSTFEGVASYQCDPGWDITGNSTRLCLGGQWQGIQPLCSEVECPTPVSPADGYIKIVNFTGSYKTGTSASYFCSEGYSLTGEDVRTCSGGQWTGESPSCQPLSCGSPPHINNTALLLLNQSTTLYSLAVYHCQHPYSFNHSSTDVVMVSQCLEDGLWSTVESLCLLHTSPRASPWPVITISLLVLVIFLLLSCLLWLYGYDRIIEMVQRKPNLMSQGVCTRNISNSEILEFQASLGTGGSTLSSFYKDGGSVMGIKHGQQSSQDCSTAGPQHCSTSSERSSGDGEESLYATIRRKKSFQICHFDGGEIDTRQSPTFLPELMTRFENEVSEPQLGLVRPSQIKRFVSSQTKPAPE